MFRTRCLALACALALVPWHAVRSAGDAPPEADAREARLADALVAALSPAERDALLTARRSELTSGTFRRLVAHGLERIGRDPNTAVSVFETAVAIAEHLDDDGLRATALTHLALIHVLRGEVLDAERQQEQAERLAHASGDARAQAYVLSRGAELHVQRGRYAEARASLEQCRTLFETLGDTLELGRALGNLGRIALDLGEPRRAIEAYAGSVRILEQRGAAPIVGRALNGLGTAHFAAGENARALELFEKARNIARSFGNRLGEMEALDDIAAVHAAQGDMDLALRQSDKAVALAREVRLPPVLGLMLLNSGRIHGEAGRRGSAAARFREAARIAEETGTRWLELHARTGLGQIALAEGRPAESEEHHARTLAIAEAIGANAFVCTNLADMALIHLRRGEAGRALEEASRAAALARAEGNLLGEWQPRLVAARALRALGRDTEARSALDASIDVVEMLRRQSLETSRQWFLGNKTAPFEEAVGMALQASDLPAALAYSERAKARALLDALDAPRRERRLGPEELIREGELLSRLRDLNVAKSRELLRNPPNPTALERLRTALQRARLDLEEFESTLHALHPERLRATDAPGSQQAFTADDLTLDEDTVVLEFVVGEERTHVLALRRTRDGSGPRLVAHTVACSRTRLRREVGRFRQRIAAREVAFATEARRLYRQLLGPLAREIAGRRTLLLVPDDALWQLPFQALQNANGRYLIEDHAIYSVPSLSVLQRLVDRDLTRLAAGRGRSARLLAFGNPALGGTLARLDESGRRGLALSPLPEAEAEVAAIARLYDSAAARVLTGAHATETALKSEAGAYDVIHLAAHARLDDTSPLYSHVVLARDGAEDGLLEAWEVRRLSLSARLVLLSACQSGDGRVTPGEGLVGTSWALFAAGASAAVVSQWEVDSASSERLMVDFHRHWQTQGAPKAEALRQAALALLRSPRERHPYYWAGFVVVGAGG